MISTTKSKTETGQDLFLSRLYDALETSYRQEGPVLTVFLTPAEQDLARHHLSHAADLCFWGGHEQAERRQLLIGADTHEATDIVCLHAVLSRHDVPLKHPQVLGALMSLGIDRSQTGDILCTDSDVRIFVRSHLAEFIMAELHQAGRVKLKWQIETDPIIDTPLREEIEVVAASQRLDAIVAALAHCSRAASLEKIRAGEVKVNDVPVGKNRMLCDNDLVSIRRAGRFRFLGCRAATKKGRSVLAFERYL